ncbi:hypothetical protein COB18_01855 [Candidatus Kaiserbacteria bacterium]|nr:MAG: hypothetical protein COB18_01855 [Candidatus Kaiserbacteria bacterium]
MLNKKYLLVLLFATIIFVGTASNVSAATIYTNSSTGNDTTGDGTSGAPYKTFHKAYTEASTNDIIDVTGVFDWTNADEAGDSSTTGYTLSKNLTINGQGAATTFIQSAATTNTADRRVFTVPLANTVTIQNIGIRYGKISSGDGGGIHVSGILTLDGVYVFSNISAAGFGGGVDVRGSALIQNSTIEGNSAYSGGGGLNRNYYSGSGGTPGASDVMDVLNSTITDNAVTRPTAAYREGGGIYFRRGGGSITNSTVYNNVVTNGPSASTHGVGTGEASIVVLLKNSIIAGNALGVSGGDIGMRSTSNGTYTDNGGNIIGRLGYSVSLTATTTTWIDATAYNLAVDGTYVLQDGGSTSGQIYINSNLETNSSVNGTQTHSITNPNSIAINNAITGVNGSISVPSTDQRTVSRGGTPDIGAYEYETDVVNPTALYFNPADNATSVGVNANFEIAFTEDVATSTGNIILYKTSDDSTIETIDVTGSKVTASSTTAFIINPSATLDGETEYYFFIDATAVDDISGNSYSGITASTTWSFTTADISNPVVSTLSPSDDATAVSIDSNFVVTFSENVATSTGNILLRKESDDSVIETFDVSSSVLITGSGTTYTINPTSDLAYDTSYYVQIASTVFDDTAGNSYAGISDTTSWSFTAADTPVCPNIAHTATYNSYPTCGIATCSSGYNLSGSQCVASAGNGMIFSGPMSSLIDYVAPRMQIVYPDGRVVYLDDVTDAEIVVDKKETSVTEVQVSTSVYISMDSFPRDLELGSTGEDVKSLQKYLNAHGFVLALNGAGSIGGETEFFGSLTKKALIKFQNTYQEEILTPINLVSGTGYFGRMTIDFIGKM